MSTKTDIALTKLGAVFIIVLALHNLAYYISFMMGSAEYVKIAIVVFCLIFVLPAAIAYVLWRFPNMVTGTLYSDREKETGQSNYTDMALLIGVSLIGLYTLVFGVIDLVYFEAHRYAELQLAKDASFPDYPVLPETVAGRVTNILQVILGIILIYGRKGIALFLHRIRTAGVKAT